MLSVILWTMINVLHFLFRLGDLSAVEAAFDLGNIILGIGHTVL